MWNDDYYYVLEDEFGPFRAKLVAESHRESIDEVEKVRTHVAPRDHKLWTHMTHVLPKFLIGLRAQLGLNI